MINIFLCIFFFYLAGISECNNIIRNIFYDNRSGAQARDSEVVFAYNELISNRIGANFFRLDLQAHHNVFANNEQDGLRIREGATLIEDNLMLGNRFGLLVADANYTEIQRNFIGSNLEGGLALRNSDHFRVTGNAVQYNGINGIIIRESRGIISGITVAANGVRGFAIESDSGTISQNNIFANGMYGIGLEGSGDIEARENWWEHSDLVREIYDSGDESTLGTVRFMPQSKEPHPFVWAWRAMPVQFVWGGTIEADIAPSGVVEGRITHTFSDSVTRSYSFEGDIVDGVFSATGTGTMKPHPQSAVPWQVEFELGAQ